MQTRGDSLSIDLVALEQRIIEAWLSVNLAQAVQDLTGPVANLLEARRRDTAQWETLFNKALIQTPLRPEIVSWLERLRSQGVLRRYGIDQARVLLAQALAVAARLPSAGISLAELAVSTVGDAHALDLGAPLGTLVIRLAPHFGGVTCWDDAISRREAWGAMGVLLDDLSGPVLVLNLRAAGPHPITQVLNTWADAGEPCHLTFRQLRRTPPGFSLAAAGPRVFVCENPNIIAAAAERLGRGCAPLVCTEGQPRTTLHELLRQLVEAGIHLRYHGDFDWPGIQMANAMISRHGAVPWQMRAEDYRHAAVLDFPLSGMPISANWDPELQPAMQFLGRAVHEELVADRLLAELA